MRITLLLSKKQTNKEIGASFNEGEIALHKANQKEKIQNSGKSY